MQVEEKDDDEEEYKPSVAARGLLVIDEVQRKELLDKGDDILEDVLFSKAMNGVLDPESTANELLLAASMAPMRSLLATMSERDIDANKHCTYRKQDDGIQGEES